MKKILLLLIAMGSLSCKKTLISQAKPSAMSSITYTNDKAGLFVVQLINLGSKTVYNGIMMPSNVSSQLILPSKLPVGNYDVVLSPEGAVSKSTTVYNVDGFIGSTSSYPLILRNVYLPVDNVGDITISVR